MGLPFMLAEEEHQHTALARTDTLDYTRTMMLTQPRRALAALLFAFTVGAACTACNDADTHFTVQHAPDLKQMTVSVLGVFKEGRMSPETWDEIGPKISAAFGKGLCPIAYDAKLVTDKPSLAEAVDDYARENGVTDDLLDQLAPAASGDAVLVITVAGRPIKQQRDTSAGQMPPRRTRSSRWGSAEWGEGCNAAAERWPRRRRVALASLTRTRSRCRPPSSRRTTTNRSRS